jgi:hypothetical protein
MRDSNGRDVSRELDNYITGHFYLLPNGEDQFRSSHDRLRRRMEEDDNDFDLEPDSHWGNVSEEEY